MHMDISPMLKITLLDSAKELRFRLEGRLSGPWVNELRQCWLTASSTTGGRRTVVDLRDVDFVDPSGETLLRELRGVGVELLAATPFMKAVVERIAVAGCDTVEEKSSRTANALLCTDPLRSHPGAV
jgi:hypothetical protein